MGLLGRAPEEHVEAVRPGRDRLGVGEGTGVQGLAEDDPVDAVGHELVQLVQVAQVVDTAARDDRPARALAELREQVPVLVE